MAPSAGRASGAPSAARGARAPATSSVSRGIAGRRARRELSYGQRKLLEFAAVLMSGPRLVLLDEPTAGVNPVLVEAIERHIRALHARGLTFLVVEHDMNARHAALRPGDRPRPRAKIAEGSARRRAAPTRASSTRTSGEMTRCCIVSRASSRATGYGDVLRGLDLVARGGQSPA